MWLLNAHTRILECFQGSDIPSYAILSHRWEADELTFKDVQKNRYEGKRGYRKVELCCKQAIAHGLQYVWIDTCCIDQRSSAELSEAINSMYRWYAQANVCYAYLSDIEAVKDDVMKSQWFTRGWTLQELLAPKIVQFFDRTWTFLGSKVDLSEDITHHTEIPLEALDDFLPSDYMLAQRMSWAANRVTTRVEDRAYSLLGIVDVNLPLLYGEGDKAFYRLQEEIMKTSRDLTLFAWSRCPNQSFGMLAASPDSFSRTLGQQDCYCFPEISEYMPEFTNYVPSKLGVSGSFILYHYAFNIYFAVVAETWLPFRSNVPGTASPAKMLGIYLQYMPDGKIFRRLSFDGVYLEAWTKSESKKDPENITICWDNAPKQISERLSSYVFGGFESFTRFEDDSAEVSVSKVSTSVHVGHVGPEIAAPGDMLLMSSPTKSIEPIHGDMSSDTYRDSSLAYGCLIAGNIAMYFGYDKDLRPRVFLSAVRGSVAESRRNGTCLKVLFRNMRITAEARNAEWVRRSLETPYKTPPMEELLKAETIQVGVHCRVSFLKISGGHRILLSFDYAWSKDIRNIVPRGWYIPEQLVDGFWKAVDERKENSSRRPIMT